MFSKEEKLILLDAVMRRLIQVPDHPNIDVIKVIRDKLINCFQEEAKV